MLPDHLGQTVGRVIAHLRDSNCYNSVCRKQSAGTLWFLRSKGSLFAFFAFFAFCQPSSIHWLSSSILVGSPTDMHLDVTSRSKWVGETEYSIFPCCLFVFFSCSSRNGDIFSFPSPHPSPSLDAPVALVSPVTPTTPITTTTAVNPVIMSKVGGGQFFSAKTIFFQKWSEMARKLVKSLF